jgi:cytochrome c-type protein NapB
VPPAARPAILLAGLACLLVSLCVSGCRTTPSGARAVYRRVQRAYDGAPPVIPHAVRALQRQNCLSCHEHGMRLGDGSLAARTPHPQYRSCQQCHVEQATRDDGLARNTFAGMRGPARGSRAWAGAPPTIPHDLDSRRNCLGCHDALGGSPIATPHADRVNCPQCHVAQRPGVAPWRANTFAGAQP